MQSFRFMLSHVLIYL